MMNKKQRALCVVVIFIIVGMSVYPPFNLHARDGVVVSLGYRWFFAPPDPGTIDTALLFAQWLGTLIVGSIVFILLRSER